MGAEKKDDPHCLLFARGLLVVLVLVILMDVLQFALDKDPLPLVPRGQLSHLQHEQCIHWNHYGLPNGEYGPCPNKAQPGWYLR